MSEQQKTREELVKEMMAKGHIEVINEIATPGCPGLVLQEDEKKNDK